MPERRIGLPVLPEGAWESLVRVDEDNEEILKDSNNDESNNNDNAKSRKHDSDHMKSGGGMVRNMKGPDWNCESCGNVNWCWRSNCNKCSTAKPKAVHSNEVRVGTGGGFLERQERASTMSVEIAEDGYDDFGRRLKKAAVVEVANDAEDSSRIAAADALKKKKDKEAAALARLQASYVSNQLEKGDGLEKRSSLPQESKSSSNLDDDRRSRDNRDKDYGRKDSYSDRDSSRYRENDKRSGNREDSREWESDKRYKDDRSYDRNRNDDRGYNRQSSNRDYDDRRKDDRRKY